MLKYLLAGLLLVGAVLPSDTIESQGRRWTYYSVSPESFDTPPPMILLFHGTGGSGGGFLDRSGWADKARQEGFVVVAPSGQCRRPDEPANFLSNPRAWNFRDSQGDDQAFAVDLADKALATFHADPRRVYLVGHSAGAGFCFRLAASQPQRWAGIGCVQGPAPVAPAPLARPVPTICVFGAEDPIIPVAGGDVNTPWGLHQSRPVVQMLGDWAGALGFQGQMSLVSEDDRQRTEEYGPDLRAVYLKGHGHNYPSPTQPQVDDRFGPVRAWKCP
ncbi:MAG: PHB depolymerase family esterase [Vulcanimicrobiota bacterium]